MTNTEIPASAVEEASAQLTTAEIRVEKRPSPAPEGDDGSPPSLKKQKKIEEGADEPMKDAKAEDIPIPPTPKKETTVAEPVAPSTKLLVKKLSAKGKIPTRGSALAAGYDMYRYVFVYFRQFGWVILISVDEIVLMRLLFRLVGRHW